MKRSRILSCCSKLSETDTSEILFPTNSCHKCLFSEEVKIDVKQQRHQAAKAKPFLQLAGIWNGLLIKSSCGKSVNISCRATSPFSVQSEFCAGLTFDRGVSYVRPGEGYLWENHTGLYHVSCSINELIVIALSCTPLPLLLLILQFCDSFICTSCNLLV